MDFSLEDVDNGNEVFAGTLDDGRFFILRTRFNENFCEERFGSKTESLNREICNLEASLMQKKSLLERARKTILQGIQYYNESKSEQKQKHYLLKLDLFKLEQNCELNKKMLELKEERKLINALKISELEFQLNEKEELMEVQVAIVNSKTVSIKSDESVLKSYQNEIIDIQAEIECVKNLEEILEMLEQEEDDKLTFVFDISELEFRLKEKEELREKQAAIINSKTVSIKSEESVLKSYQNEIIDIQAEIKNLKTLDERLEVYHQLQVQIIQEEAKQLEDHIRVSKSEIFRDYNSTKMEELAQGVEIMEEVEKKIEKELEKMQNKLNESEIASNSLFTIPIPPSPKIHHAGSSQDQDIQKFLEDFLEDLSKESFEDPENDEETPTSLRKRQKRFKTPERD